MVADRSERVKGELQVELLQGSARGSGRCLGSLGLATAAWRSLSAVVSACVRYANEPYRFTNSGEHSISAMMTSLAEQLQELLDKQAIAEVLFAYCAHLDRMDLEALAALFTEDCVVDYGPEARLQSHGADGLRRDLARMWRWSRTSHHLSNVVVKLEGDGQHAVAIQLRDRLARAAGRVHGNDDGAVQGPARARRRSMADRFPSAGTDRERRRLRREHKPLRPHPPPRQPVSSPISPPNAVQGAGPGASSLHRGFDWWSYGRKTAISPPHSRPMSITPPGPLSELAAGWPY